MYVLGLEVLGNKLEIYAGSEEDSPDGTAFLSTRESIIGGWEGGGISCRSTQMLRYSSAGTA